MRFVIKNSTIVYLFIILLATSPAVFLGEGNRNLLLIGAMLISPLILLRYPVVIPKIDIPLVGLCLMMTFFPLVLHPETMRWSTILYSYLFCFFFMAFVRVFYHCRFTSIDFLRLLKGLIYAYCIVLIIQQFCVLTGLPIFNVSNYDPSDPWKLNSLMSEPSHSARVIPILMYFFMETRKLRNPLLDLKTTIREDWLVWVAFLWAMITMGSSTAVLFFIIILLQFINLRRYFMLSITVVTLFLSLMLFSENEIISRTRNMFFATLTLDSRKIIETDLSASFRIVPTIQGLNAIDMSEINGWLGHGVDADTKLIEPLPTVESGNAGAFMIWFNFGFFAAITYWLFTFSICYQRSQYTSILIWFLIIFLYGGFNTQIVWLTLVLNLTYKLLDKHAHSQFSYIKTL